MKPTVNSSFCCIAAIAAVLAFPAAAQAQDTSPQAETPEPAGEDYPEEEGQIVVVADSLFGEVDSPVPPVAELGEADIAAYGANSVADLVAALAPQTGSARGRGSGGPVFLVNGLRVSSFREFRSYPPEAIQKVEVLSEEVAQQFGFSADQRVLNFILKPNFTSYEVEGEFEQPGIGGYHRWEAEASLLKLTRNGRFNVSLETEDTSPMTEAVRGIEQAEGSTPGVAGDPDPAEYRTLQSDSRSFQGDLNYTTKVGDGGTSLSLNGSAERSESQSLSGLDTVLLSDGSGNSVLRTFNADDPLGTANTNTTYAFGSTLNSPIGDWQFTGTLNATRGINDTVIERRADTQALRDAALAGTLALDGDLPMLADAGSDTAQSKTWRIESATTLMGNPLLLPGGEVNLTLNAGYDWVRLSSNDTRRSELGETELTRGRVKGGFNLGVPITSRREGFGDALGDITLNLTGGLAHLSDFGTLTDWSAGLSWGITEKLNFQATFFARDSAPGLSQLGNPQVVTDNVTYYDLSRNETVLITTTTGGNPFLVQEKQRDLRVAAFWDLPLLENSAISVEYNRNTSDDVTASFPSLTPAVESAFADRVTRDASGRLVSLDLRPVTFAEQNSSRLRFGLNLSGSLGSANDEADSSPGFAPRPPANGMAAGQGGAGGQRGNFDPERFREMRIQICGAATVAEQPAELPDLTEDDLANLPPQMLERLKGPDGQIDMERVKQLRERICSSDGPPAGRGQGQAGQGSGARAQGGPPPGAGRGPGGFRGPGRRGGNGQGRWFANLTYTRELTSEVLIADGLPVLDQLAGESVSSNGTSRDSAEFVGGMFYEGFGMRWRASYSGPSDVLGSGAPGSTDLHFGGLAKFDVRLFANLGDQESIKRAAPWLDGVRLAFVVDNIFDSRRTVTDSNGDTPLRYQPYLLDPTGRYIGIDIRKVF